MSVWLCSPSCWNISCFETFAFYFLSYCTRMMLYLLCVLIFYAPEAHIMYLKVSSSFLISFVMGGGATRAGWLSSLMHLSGPSRVIMSLYSLAPPPPTVWALDLPLNTLLKSPGGSCAWTYDLYSPVHNVLYSCISITRGSGRGLGPGILEFFGPQMALAYRIDAFSQGPKNSRIPEPNPLPLPLIMDMQASKTLCMGLYKS